MTNPPPQSFLPNNQITQEMSAFLLSEVPVEFDHSLPLPTLRWGPPAYASFAAPVGRDQTTTHGGPEFWWALDAELGRCLIFARYTVLPFGPREFESVTLPPFSRTLEAQQQLIADLNEELNSQAKTFFLGLEAPPAERGLLLRLLKASIPEPLMHRYRSLTPDFFTWLEQPA